MNLGNVDLNLLVALDAILRERNVTRAAERLRLSQPAVSNSLSRLRKLFDDPLLIRTGRAMQLTPRAESLVRPVAEALAIINSCIENRPEFDASRDKRTFTLMVSDYAAIVLVRPLLRAIARLGPELSVRIVPVFDVSSALERDEIDVAIIPEQASLEDGLITFNKQRLLHDAWVAVRWTGAADVGPVATRETLESLPHLTYAPPGGRAISDIAMERIGLSWRIEAYVDTFAVMPFLLRGSEMIAIIPRKLAGELAEPADLRILELDVPVPRLIESGFWHPRREAQPAHQWLLAQLAAFARESDVLPPAGA